MKIIAFATGYVIMFSAVIVCLIQAGFQVYYGEPLVQNWNVTGEARIEIGILLIGLMCGAYAFWNHKFFPEKTK